jgi:hypothetical protein
VEHRTRIQPGQNILAWLDSHKPLLTVWLLILEGECLPSQEMRFLARNVALLLTALHLVLRAPLRCNRKYQPQHILNVVMLRFATCDS